MSPPLEFEMEYIRHGYPLTFEYGGRYLHLQEFMKPGELKHSIISHPLGFYKEKVPDGWEEFGAHLKRLVGQPYVWKPRPTYYCSRDENKDFGGVLRLVILSHGPLHYDFSNSDDDEEDVDEEEDWLRKVKPLLKVKLLPYHPYPEHNPAYDKEQHYLAKLARVCGHENLVLEMRTASWEDEEDYLWCSGVQLLWNEEQKAWEGEAEISLKHAVSGIFNDDHFGYENDYTATMWNLKIKLNEKGVNRVLQQSYFKGGGLLDYGALREMLDNGRFSDVVITGANDDDKKVEFKGHRMLLTAASTVFGDMLNTNWEEGKTGTVKLPESEDTIQAMLDFIYYGGTERILAAGPEVVLELLQAGHKYMIENLVEVAAMALKMKIGLEQWFSVDVAVELFCFARNVDGKLWKELVAKCCRFLEGKKSDELVASEGYLKLHQIAVKLGPVFESVFIMASVGAECKIGSLPQVPVGMPKEEVLLIYDFLTACKIGGDKPKTLEIAVGMLVLAEYGGRASPNFTNEFVKGFFEESETEKYTVDLLVELFCTARAKEDKCWGFLKMAAVDKLKELLTKEPKETKASAKFQEMLKTNQEAAAELTRLTGLTLEETKKAKKRKRT